MKTRIEKCGSIYIEVPESDKPYQKKGAQHLRKLVEWMNSRKESLNENKSSLDLLGEFNTWLRKERKEK